MPVTMGGLASGMDTDDIIKKLVEVESQPIKQLERSKLENNQKKEALKQLESHLKDLDEKTRKLYGFRASYDEKLAVSSDETVIVARATKKADVGTTQIEVLQVADFHKISSDCLERDKKIGSGKVIIEVNGEKIPIRFKGGKLKGLSQQIAEEASELVSVSYINTTGKDYIITLTSKVSGKKGAIIISGSESLLKEVGFISGEKIKKSDDAVIVFDKKYFSAYAGKEDISDQDGDFQISSDGKSLTMDGIIWQEYELPVVANIKKNTVLTFNFKHIKEIEEKVPRKVEMGPEEVINIKGISLKSYNISRFRPLGAKEKKKFDSVTGIGVVAIDGDNRTEKIYPIELGSNDKREILLGREFNGQKISKIIFYSNDGKSVFSEPLIFTPSKIKGDYELKNLIAEAKNTKLKIDGVEIEREGKSDLADVVKGLSLDIKKVSENPIELKVSLDIDKSIKSLTDFVEAFNLYLDYNKFLTKTVKVEKPGETGKLKESGLFVGDMSIVRLENAVRHTVGGAYFSRAKKPFKLLSQIGISTGEINANWESIKQGKLVIDEPVLRSSIADNPEGVSMFFGSDTDGDNTIDDGMAYKLVNVLKPYISFGKNIIKVKIDLEDNSIKLTNERIERKNEHIRQFEAKLRKKFSAMEKSVSGSKYQQQWMNQQMGGSSKKE